MLYIDLGHKSMLTDQQRLICMEYWSNSNSSEGFQARTRRLSRKYGLSIAKTFETILFNPARLSDVRCDICGEHCMVEIPQDVTKMRSLAMWYCKPCDKMLAESIPF